MLRTIWNKWKVVGAFLGNVVARVVLTLFYFTIFAPFGLATRLTSDRLHLRGDAGGHWQRRTTAAVSIDAARGQS